MCPFSKVPRIDKQRGSNSVTFCSFYTSSRVQSCILDSKAYISMNIIQGNNWHKFKFTSQKVTFLSQNHFSVNEFCTLACRVSQNKVSALRNWACYNWPVLVVPLASQQNMMAASSTVTRIWWMTSKGVVSVKAVT